MCAWYRWLTGQPTEAHPNSGPYNTVLGFSVNGRRLQAAELIGQIASRANDIKKRQKRLVWNRIHHHQTTKN